MGSEQIYHLRSRSKFDNCRPFAVFVFSHYFLFILASPARDTMNMLLSRLNVICWRTILLQYQGAELATTDDRVWRMTAGTPWPDGRNILISYIATIRIFYLNIIRRQLGRLAAALCRLKPGRNPNLYLAECPVAHARSPCKIGSSIRTLLRSPLPRGGRVCGPRGAERFSTVLTRRRLKWGWGWKNIQENIIIQYCAMYTHTIWRKNCDLYNGHIYR